MIESSLDSASRPLALRPKDAARAIGIGTRLLWSLTSQGKIPHVRVGRVVLYPLPALEAWLESRLEQKGGRR